MKIDKLFSTTGLFETIIFKDSLNIILGKYSTEGKDINGIGKTTIVDLIDLCLLADHPKQIFRKSKYEFLEDHSVSLSVIVNSKHMVLTKYFNNLNNIFVQIDNGEITEYSDTDYRIILGKLLTMDNDYSGVSDPQWFRTLMGYFVQNDHAFFQRDSKDVTKFANYGLRKAELLTYVFFLIGCDNKAIYEYDILQVRQKQIQDDQNRLKVNIKNVTGKEVQDFKAEVDQLNTEIQVIEKKANEYQFFDINQGMISDYERIQYEIRNREDRYNVIEHKLLEIRRSLSYGIDLDIDRVRVLYNELNRDFSSFIVKTLQEVVSFRSELIQNRKKFLLEREIVYNKELELLKMELVDLEEKKKKYYQLLEQKAVLDDLKAAYTYLGDKKTKNEQNKVFVIELDRIEREASINRNQISNTINNMVLEKSDLDEVMKDIKRIFYDVVRSSVEISDTDLQTHISIEPRANVKSPISIDIQVPRSGSLGKDRFKILAFDITIFISILEKNRKLPHFLIHDGVFHGIAHKTRIKYLNYTHNKLKSFPHSQYIITLNEDEISLPEDYSDELSHLDFDINECVVKILEDDPSKMFFRKEF